MAQQQGRYQGVVLYSDYDGTLTDSADVLPPENVAALERFQAEGGRFALATGKGLPAWGRMALPVSAPLILQNGVGAYDTVREQWVWRAALDAGAAQAVRAIEQAFPQVGIIVHAADRALVLRENRASFDAAARPWIERVPADADVAALCTGANMLSVFGDPEEVDAVRALMADGFPDLACTVSYPGFLDIMRAGCSKGAALAQLRARGALEGARLVVAVGDGENDTELLDEADLAFTVADGHPGLAAHADRVLEPRSVPVIPQILAYLDEMYV